MRERPLSEARDLVRQAAIQRGEGALEWGDGRWVRSWPCGEAMEARQWGNIPCSEAMRYFQWDKGPAVKRGGLLQWGCCPAVKQGGPWVRRRQSSEARRAHVWGDGIVVPWVRRSLCSARQALPAAFDTWRTLRSQPDLVNQKRSVSLQPGKYRRILWEMLWLEASHVPARLVWINIDES